MLASRPSAGGSPQRVAQLIGATRAQLFVTEPVKQSQTHGWRPVSVTGAPAHAATASAASGITATLARKVTGLLSVMSLPRLGHRQSQLSAVIESGDA
jgi:hypothetical protein